MVESDDYTSPLTDWAAQLGLLSMQKLVEAHVNVVHLLMLHDLFSFEPIPSGLRLNTS